MDTPTTEIALPPHQAGPARLVTARSYLVDRFVPDCEVVALPGKEVAGGRLGWRRGPVELPAVAPSGRLSRLKARAARNGIRRIEGRVLFDLRHHSPDNWAHFLNNHLPLVLRLCQAAGVDREAALLVTSGATPGYVREAAALFGFEVLPTDARVEGEGVDFEVDPWTAVRTMRHLWARAPDVQARLAEAVEGGDPLPARAFLSRRDTRTIENAAEVEAWLGARGFVTLCAEDLSPRDQIRLFREAEIIAAIHGAALGPLLYAPPDGPLRQIVEILPVGHMTDVYRVMAEQVGVDWIGVRGRIRPAYVEPAYRLDERFDRFSLDSFEVDVASLELAFELAGMGRDANG